MPETNVQKLSQMTTDAARNASDALTKLSGQEVTVEASRVEISRIQKKGA